jgi:cell division protein FtsL
VLEILPAGPGALLDLIKALREVEMVDWAGSMETRNYAIRREIDTRNLLDLLLISLSIGMVAGVFLLHSWVHAMMVETGYKAQSLQAEERALINDQEKLTLEEQTLMSPGRIDAIAQADLGMKPPRPNQLLTPAFRDFEKNQTTTLALADAPGDTAEARKPPSTF